MTDKKQSDEKTADKNASSTEAEALKATPGKEAPAHIAAAASSVTAQDIVAAHQGLAEIDSSNADAADVGFNYRLAAIEAWLDAYGERLATLLDDHFQGKI